MNPGKWGAGEDGTGLVQVDGRIIEDAADRAVELLTDPRLREEAVEHNFRIGSKHYSLGALHSMLEGLIDS